MAHGSHIKRAITTFKNKALKFKESFIGAVSSSDLASVLAGTSNKKSKEYKAQIRNVQRWKKGTQKPSAKSKEKVEKVVKGDKELSNKLAAQDGAILTVKARDKDDTYYLRDRELEMDFSAKMLEEFFDRADEDVNDAVEFFFESIGWDWAPPIEELSLSLSRE
jgi:hypothetical protein